MRKFLKLFIIIFSICIISQAASYSEEYRVLVLPDNIQFDSTNYLVFPDSSVMFASDTINELNKDGRIKTVSMHEVRDALRNNTKLYVTTKNALKEFKYNYNIPFVDLKSIAKCFSTDKVLIITSQTDVQNYFLRRTLWDFLNIPGATVVDPAYKMSIYVTLIDVNKEIVLWQRTYYKTISSNENRMVAQNFAPATEQLEKIKFYSNYFISPEVARSVEAKILPPLIPGLEQNVVNVANTKKNGFELPALKNSTNNDSSLVLPMQQMDLKPKNIMPKRQTPNDYGAIINAL